VYERILASGEYRSPVFESGGSSLLALSGNRLVRIPTSGGTEQVLFAVDGVDTLLAADREGSGYVLALLAGEENASPRFGLISLAERVVSELEIDTREETYRELLERTSRGHPSHSHDGTYALYVK